MEKKAGKEWLIALVATIVAGLAILTLIFALPGEQPEARTSASYGYLNEYVVTVAGTGSAGAATGSGTTDGPVHGHLYAVHVDYTADISTTTDLSLTLASPALTLLTLTDTPTDTWLYPAVQQTGNTGSGISGAYDRMPIEGYLTIGAAESTSGTIATVTIWWGP